MTTTVYLSKGREAYNRLYQGPTWGLTKASKKLAKLAQKGDVKSKEINKVLSDHAKLALRLQLRGFEIEQLEQGTSQADIAMMFRATLYNSHMSESLTSLGIKTSAKTASSIFPEPFNLCHGLEDIDSAEMRQKMVDLGVAKSLPIKTLEFLRRIWAIWVSGPIVLGAAWLSYKYNFPSQLFGGEDSGTGFMSDVLTGGVAGLLIVGLPTQLVDKYLSEEQIDATVGRALEILDDFAKTELDSLGPKQIPRVIEILYTLNQEDCVRYLSSLGYEKLALLDPVYEKKDSLDLAYVQCKDTPSGKLFSIAEQRDDRIALAAFEEVRDKLTPAQLKLLVPHKVRTVRRQAFALVAEDFTADDLDDMATKLINIPLLFTHPKAAHNTKVLSLIATSKKEQCRSLFELFTPWMSENDVQKIIAVLSSIENSEVVEENLTIFLEILSEQDFQLSRVAIGPEKSL